MSKYLGPILLVFWMLILGAPVLLSAQERYIASYAGFAGFQAPLWAAQDFGLLAKYNINMDLVMIPGSARGAQALLGGSTHFGQIDGTALISAINQTRRTGCSNTFSVVVRRRRLLGAVSERDKFCVSNSSQRISSPVSGVATAA